MNEVNIDGTIYVPKESNVTNADGLPMVMIRTYSAGVFYGYLSKRESTLAGIEVTIMNARRVHYWDGAASLSQLAMEGTSKPESCRFPCTVTSIELVAIEIIPMTEKAFNSLNSVEVWEK